MRISSNIIITTCLLIAILVSCNNKKSGLENRPEIININIDEIQQKLLNVIIEDVIPLETSQNSLLGDNYKVKYFNNRFYILNANRFEQPALFVFDDKGNFIKKTITGKGPGEVLEPKSFTINKRDSVVFLHDMILYSETKVFDKNLNYIKSLKHDGLMVKDFYHINRDTFLIYTKERNLNFKQGKQFYTYSLFTDAFSKKENLDIFLYGDKGSQSLLSPVSIINNEVLFVSPYNYNIYQLVDGEEKIRYILDFGKYNFNSKEFATLSNYEIRGYVAQGKRIGKIYSLHKTDDFLVISTAFGEKIITFFQSLDNNMTYCFNDCFDYNIIPECLIWGIKDDGTFYGLVEPDQIKKFQESRGQYKEIEVDESDNQYVILFKVRKP